jgi:hypothetical protein
MKLAPALPLLVLLMCALTASPLRADEPPAFTFTGNEYVFRWSKNHQYEFTPVGQTNLTTWTDMVTRNDYPGVTNGEALASRASAVLETYKAARAMVVRTDSVPRTPTRPAEHVVVVLFPRPDFIEAVFTRFLLRDGQGMAITYSHRKYGRRTGTEMSDWLKANGPATEKALMTWEKLPASPAK